MGLLWLAALFLAASHPPAPGVTPDEALARLLEGNKRFIAQTAQNPRRDAARLREVSASQHPFAVILSCSDSRLPPEVVFDQGLGDLFTIRVAGNVTDDAIIGSIEYAVEHLGARLVVVMGHQNCGAVQAAMSGGEAGNHIHSFVDDITSLVEQAKKMPGDPVDNCVRLNVNHVVEALRTSQPILAEAVRAAKLRIIGAYYSLQTGAVSLLPEATGQKSGDR